MKVHNILTPRREGSNETCNTSSYTANETEGLDPSNAQFFYDSSLMSLNEESKAISAEHFFTSSEWWFQQSWK